MSRELRQRLDQALRTDSDFDAFCQDFFPDVKRRFSAGMDRVAKTSLLLEVVEDPAEIAGRLDELNRTAGTTTAARYAPPVSPTATAGGDRSSVPLSGSPVELSLDHVKAACARIVAAHRQGTGYLVRPDLLITCAHVVRPLPPDIPISVQFYDQPTPQQATVESFDDQADWAILRLQTSTRDRLCLPAAAQATADTRWLAFGYPDSAGKHGIVLAGSVRDPRGKDDQGILAMQLFCEEAAAARGAVLGGASGSPVLSGGRLIGHVRRVNPDESDRSQLGLVYGCPASAYASALGTEASPVQPTAYQARSPQAEYDPLWYVPRRDAELLALNKLREVGVPVTLQAPEGYGKAWLTQHLLSRIAQQDSAAGQHTEVARFNLRKDASPAPATLEALLMTLLQSVLEQLGVEDIDTLLTKAGRVPGDAKRKFRRAFEQHVLKRPGARFLLVLEEADQLHGTPIETDFFAVLRAMSEDRTPDYRRLRLLVTIGAEAGFLETTNHSAFFGLSTPIVLDGFSLVQLRAEAALYGLAADDPGLVELHRLTRGHPFYSRVAMYEAVCGEKSLAEVLEATDARGGLFASSLQRLRSFVEREGLRPVVSAILASPRCTVPADTYLRLYRKGLVVESTPGEYHLRCPLFDNYFRALYQ